MYAQEIIIPAYIIKFIGLFLSILTLYAYYKLQVLKKPPGRLIFIQLIILLIMQLNDTFDLILSHIRNPNVDCKATDYISIATHSSCSLYEVCIALEVLIRIKSAPMGQKYNVRRVFYHIISISGGLALLIIALIPYPDCNDEFKLKGTENK
jgi:hypothetical protein